MSTVLGILSRQENVVIGAQSSLAASALDSLSGGLFRTVSGFTGLVVDADVSVDHLRQSDVTEYPVEDGAKITDHVQLKPAQLTVQGVISDYPIGFAVIGGVANLISTGVSLIGGGSRSIDAFNHLEKLWRERKPFSVFTGIKRYSNMVIEELSVPQTAQTGRAIHFTARMKEIRIVASKTAALSLASSVSDLGSRTNDQGHEVTKTIADPTASANDAQTKSGQSILDSLLNGGG